MTRDGTCIEDVHTVEGWRSTCGHGFEWPMGVTLQTCRDCVLGRCEHAKANVSDEQGRML